MALPYEPPELPAAMEDIKSKKYAITARADWRIPTAFAMIKLQLRWIRYYFTNQFNAQRAGKPLAMRTLDSECCCPLHCVPNLSASSRHQHLCVGGADTEQRLQEFIGFCCKYFAGIQWQTGTLVNLISNPWHLAYFISFQLKRATGSATMMHSFHACCKVIVWALHRVCVCSLPCLSVVLPRPLCLPTHQA